MSPAPCWTRGETVVGIDNFSDYYDPVLKFARVKPLRERPGFTFIEGDISDRETMLGLADRPGGLDRIVHLAAQPGIRHSKVDPYIYVQTNVMGHLVLLELARELGAQPGTWSMPRPRRSMAAMHKFPFAVGDPVDHPVSLYAATKRVRRADDRDLRAPVRAQGHRPALFHGLRALGAARHVAVHLRPGDPRGPHDPALSPRQAEARLQLHRRHRGRHPGGARPAAAEAAGIGSTISAGRAARRSSTSSRCSRRRWARRRSSS